MALSLTSKLSLITYALKEQYVVSEAVGDAEPADSSTGSENFSIIRDISVSEGKLLPLLQQLRRQGGECATLWNCETKQLCNFSESVHGGDNSRSARKDRSSRFRTVHPTVGNVRLLRGGFGTMTREEANKIREKLGLGSLDDEVTPKSAVERFNRPGGSAARPILAKIEPFYKYKENKFGEKVPLDSGEADMGEKLRKLKSKFGLFDGNDDDDDGVKDAEDGEDGKSPKDAYAMRISYVQFIADLPQPKDEDDDDDDDEEEEQQDEEEEEEDSDAPLFFEEDKDPFAFRLPHEEQTEWPPILRGFVGSSASMVSKAKDDLTDFLGHTQFDNFRHENVLEAWKIFLESDNEGTIGERGFRQVRQVLGKKPMTLKMINSFKNLMSHFIWNIVMRSLYRISHDGANAAEMAVDVFVELCKSKKLRNMQKLQVVSRRHPLPTIDAFVSFKSKDEQSAPVLRKGDNAPPDIDDEDTRRNLGRDRSYNISIEAAFQKVAPERVSQLVKERFKESEDDSEGEGGGKQVLRSLDEMKDIEKKYGWVVKID
eukprot:jgi/Bigna1/75959/fgenesh1_pg.38_\